MAANSSLGSSFLPHLHLLLLLLLLLSPASCFTTADQQQMVSSDSSTAPGLLFEEKARLGSIPPSCHNKCNQCHPCMAVQVPTLPGNSALRPALTSSAAIPMEFFDSSPPSAAAGNRYSNYKPLGWKCHCGGHFFNP